MSQEMVERKNAIVPEIPEMLARMLDPKTLEGLRQIASISHVRAMWEMRFGPYSCGATACKVEHRAGANIEIHNDQKRLWFTMATAEPDGEMAGTAMTVAEAKQLIADLQEAVTFLELDGAEVSA